MSKDRRAEQQLSDRQKRTILEMYDRDAGMPSVAMGFILERYGHYELTPEAVREIVKLERAKRRARDRAGVDWSALWQSARAS